MALESSEFWISVKSCDRLRAARRHHHTRPCTRLPPPLDSRFSILDSYGIFELLLLALALLPFPFGFGCFGSNFFDALVGHVY